jgi:uncharacterized protein YggT (Ycf19 family)
MKTQVILFGIYFITLLAKLLTWAIFIHIILSWFAQRGNALTNWLNQVVTPVLRPFRFARIGMMDFSPVVAFLVIDFGSGWIIEFLSRFV